MDRHASFDTEIGPDMTERWRYTLRSRLREPACRLVGTFVLLPRVEVIEALAGAGFDAVLLDLEHGPYDVAELAPLASAGHGAGVQVVARVGELSESLIGKVLDTGVDGIIVPHVSNAAQARRAVQAARFPPDGGRSLNPYVRAAEYGAIPDFLRYANDGVAVLVMVEGADGLAKLSEITSVDGLDGVFVGPVDLSASLGHPGEPEHPTVVEAVHDILRLVAADGVAPAVYAPTPEAARRWLDLGARTVALSADLAMARAGFRQYQKGIGDRG